MAKNLSNKDTAEGSILGALSDFSLDPGTSRMLMKLATSRDRRRGAKGFSSGSGLTVDDINPALSIIRNIP